MLVHGASGGVSILRRQVTRNAAFSPESAFACATCGHIYMNKWIIKIRILYSRCIFLEQALLFQKSMKVQEWLWKVPGAEGAQEALSCSWKLVWKLHKQPCSGEMKQQEL